jgi:3-hydroxy-3-methylglutaryl CoA synthase
MNLTGIAAHGAYVPITRLPLSLAAGRPAKEGGAERAVADYDEDAVTMAVTAAIDCLTGIARESVDAVYFASTTYPLREKQGAALIAKALDLRRDVLTQDHAGSLRAGTAALESALHAVGSGALRSVLVVASDCRLGAPRGALEAKLGDGAVALLVSADPAARFESSFSIADELQDVWRIEGESFTHTWEDRFAIQEGYTPNLIAAVRGLLQKSGSSPEDFAKIALYAPDERSSGGVLRKVGFKDQQVQNPLFGRLGNTGTPFALMLFVHALETARVGRSRDRRRLRRRRARARVRGDRRDRGVAAAARAVVASRAAARDRELRHLPARARTRSQGVGGRRRPRALGHDPLPRARRRHRDAGRALHELRPGALPEAARVREVLRQGRLGALPTLRPARAPARLHVRLLLPGVRAAHDHGDDRGRRLPGPGQMTNVRPPDVALEQPVEYVFRKIHDAGGKAELLLEGESSRGGDHG